MTPATSLDCHAHVAPDVTSKQLESLGEVHVLAVTRTLKEAARVARRRDSKLTWGLGVHPGSSEAQSQYDPREFRYLLPRFALVGEIGLDRRGSRTRQHEILSDVLAACADQPVLLSLHSTGRVREVLDVMATYPHPGFILHWFLASAEEVAHAAALGAYFSVNTAMSDEAISQMPRDRVLPETDFPAKSVRARVPGATAALEDRLATLWGTDAAGARAELWRNMKALATRSGAVERLSSSLTGVLMQV
ncbi:TatD family hydrolase [Naasia aerilata]|nr:TatD family hydrolase [Naasia aerilata]